MTNITIRGAREHNLQGIDLTIPRNKLTCFVGVSGSGKSTIAFDIIAREGQRQYFESLPTFARRYLAKSNRPKVDSIEGISSSVIISQERVHGSPRSTVGTLTEAYTYLRLLYSRVGLPSHDSSAYSFNHPLGACPTCKGLGRAVEVDVSKVLDQDKSLSEGALRPSEWYVGGRQWSIIRSSGYFDLDKKLRDYTPSELDRLLHAPPEKLESQDQYIVNRWTFQGIVYRIEHRNTKVHRGPSDRDMKYFNFVDCPSCHGGRLKTSSLAVKLNGLDIGQVANLPLTQALEFINGITTPHAEAIKPRLIEQLRSLISVGVGYLTLNRTSSTLSGGEAQRVKMARQLECNLIETIYVLDEPTAGLHPRDIHSVINNLQRLRDHGNTVLVVEHDESVIRSADHLVEIGPGGGERGGQVVATGSVPEVCDNPSSLTGRYLSGTDSISAKSSYRTANGNLRVTNAHLHNLQDLNVDLPTGVLTALTGVSGSGKSSLVQEIVAQYGDQIVLVDQSAVGNNKRGCLATYTKAIDHIRNLFTKEHNMSSSFFSYNAKGACRECKGLGYTEMEMHFLGDLQLRCETCHGTRYQEKVLRYMYHGHTIADVLSMTATEARKLFTDTLLCQALDLLIEVGLDYLALGQTLNTLSGGESQRLKLASRLRARGEFYILDEPTSGLHFADIEKLLSLLNRLVDQGNSVLVVEHNLDIIRNADWVIDLGPEGGTRGGQLLASCTPDKLSSHPLSITGKYLTRTQ